MDFPYWSVLGSRGCRERIIQTAISMLLLRSGFLCFCPTVRQAWFSILKDLHVAHSVLNSLAWVELTSLGSRFLATSVPGTLPTYNSCPISDSKISCDPKWDGWVRNDFALLWDRPGFPFWKTYTLHIACATRLLGSSRLLSKVITVVCKIVHKACFGLKTRVIIKISTHPWYPMNVDWLSKVAPNKGVEIINLDLKSIYKSLQ